MNQSLLIANDFPPVTSGIATAFHQLWRHLPPNRTKILAPILPNSESVDETYPIAIHRIPMPLGEGTVAKAMKTVQTAVWTVFNSISDSPSKVHCGQIFSSGLAGWLCKQMFQIPYVVWVYGSETARLARGGPTRELMVRILEDSDWVVTNSDMTSDEFRRFGVTDRKIRRVYPGVDPEVFRPLPKNPDWVNRLGLKNKKVLLTVARLDQRKGHDMVLRALGRLKDRNLVYLIPGRGREEQRLRELTSELGLKDQVQFLGFIENEDLPTIYNLCDLFVMPNRVTQGTALAGDIEGFGITFVEAGACEKPVIGGRSGGAVEAVLHGQTGLLVDPDSETEVAETIETLLSDSNLAHTLGKQARLRIEREFDWQILSTLVEEIL